MKLPYRILSSAGIVIAMAIVGLQVSGQPALPEDVFLKNFSESFTHEFSFVLREGRIYYRPAGSGEEWKLFPPDGRPGRQGIFGFKSPERVVAISADGDNLIAVGADGVVYYVKLFDFIWTDSWGMVPKGKLSMPPGFRALAMSHRGKKLAVYYEDIFGEKHPMGAGVTTLYLLAGDGGKILYADPWLPPLFDNNVCMPLKGRFVAVNMSASASTLFVINAAGEMYTRLYDYDTAGENPVLGYTYEKIDMAAPGAVRTRGLPPEDWRKQPAIQGKITDLITILQTGAGNAARELRVEGADAKGDTGYYRKPIYAGQWEFVRTGQPLKGKLLVPGVKAPLGPKLTVDLEGRMKRSFSKIAVPVKLLDFSFLCEGGMLQIGLDGIPYSIPLYLRRVRFDEGDAEAWGMMVLPESLLSPAGKEAKNLWEKVFQRKRSLKATVTGTDKSLRITFRGGELLFP